MIARVLPAGKGDAVRQLQDDGRVMVMAGDGVNDATPFSLAAKNPLYEVPVVTAETTNVADLRGCGLDRWLASYGW